MYLPRFTYEIHEDQQCSGGFRYPYDFPSRQESASAHRFTQVLPAWLPHRSFDCNRAIKCGEQAHEMRVFGGCRVGFPVRMAGKGEAISPATWAGPLFRPRWAFVTGRTDMPTKTGPIDALMLQGMLIERDERLRRLIRKRFPTSLQSLNSEEDVLQEIWISAFKDIPSFYPESDDSFDRWLTRVANNKIINLAKHARRQKRGLDHPHQRGKWNPRSSYIALFDEIAGEGRTPSREAFTLEAAGIIQSVIADLPDDRRQAIQLRFVEGCSWEEAAASMGKSTNAVRSLAYHGISQMRNRLGPESHFFSDAPSTIDERS